MLDELGVKVGTSVDNNYRTNIIKGLNGNVSIVVDGEEIYVKSSDTLPVRFEVTKDDTYVQNIINNNSYKYGKLVNLYLNIQPKDATMGTGAYKLASGAPAPLNGIEFFAGEYISNGNILQRLLIDENGDIYWWYNNQFENSTGYRIAVNLVYLTTD